MINEEIQKILKRGQMTYIIKKKCITPENKIEALEIILASRSCEFIEKLFDNGFFTIDDVIIMFQRKPYLLTGTYRSQYFGLPRSVRFNEKFVNLILELTGQFKYSDLPYWIKVIPEVRKKYDVIGSGEGYVLGELIEKIKKNYTIINYLPNDVLLNYRFIKRLLEIIEPSWYDGLPKVLADKEEIQKKCDRIGRTKRLYKYDGIRDEEGYDRDWRNIKGELKIFFTLKGDFPIKSKEDYIAIYNKYIESKLSIKAFCKKYGITPIKGFEELLERLKLESREYYDKINSLKQEVSSNFYSFSRDMALKIVNGDVSLEEFFSDMSIDFYYANIDLYYRILSNEDKHKLACLIIDYFEKHKDLVLNNFLRFLTIRNIKPVDAYNTYVRKYLLMPQDREYIIIFHRQIKELDLQTKPFNRKKLYVKFIINNKEYIVDDAVIDQAYAYLSDNHYHISDSSMRYMTKQIAIGEIEYKEETKEQKEEMIDTILNLVLEEAKMEAYLTEMEKLHDDKKI